MEISDDPALVARRRNWVDNTLAEGTLCRDEKWTNSLAVGQQVFLETIKRRTGIQGPRQTGTV